MLATRCRPIARLFPFALVAIALSATVTTASAQSTDSTAVATVAPTSSNVTRWQFARLTSNIGGGGYSWTTGIERIDDGNYRKFLAKFGLIGLVDHPSGELALLDALGAQGWELVSCQTTHLAGILRENDVTACYFKRPVRRQPTATSAP